MSGRGTKGKSEARKKKLMNGREMIIRKGSGSSTLPSTKVKKRKPVTTKKKK